MSTATDKQTTERKPSKLWYSMQRARHVGANPKFWGAVAATGASTLAAATVVGASLAWVGLAWRVARSFMVLVYLGGAAAGYWGSKRTINWARKTFDKFKNLDRGIEEKIEKAEKDWIKKHNAPEVAERIIYKMDNPQQAPTSTLNLVKPAKEGFETATAGKAPANDTGAPKRKAPVAPAAPGK